MRLPDFGFRVQDFSFRAPDFWFMVQCLVLGFLFEAVHNCMFCLYIWPELGFETIARWVAFRTFWVESGFLFWNESGRFSRHGTIPVA